MDSVWQAYLAITVTPASSLSPDHAELTSCDVAGLRGGANMVRFPCISHSQPGLPLPSTRTKPVLIVVGGAVGRIDREAQSSADKGDR